MNVALIQGRPVRDPELKQGTASGKIFCTFTVACDRPYRGKNNPRATDYFRVVCFGKLAQTVYNNLAKGALCTVFGRLEQDRWISMVGEQKDMVQIKAQNVTIHEFLRKHRPLDELDHDFDVHEIMPEIAGSYYKQVDIDDEDIPDDLAGKSIGDV